MRSPPCLVPCLLAVFLLAAFAPAQQPGEAVLTFYSGGTSHLIAAAPGGALTTILTRPGTRAADGLVPSPLNDGALFVENVGGTLHLLEIQNGVNVTTLGAFPATFLRVPTLLADAGGEILVLNATGVDAGVYRTPLNSFSLTTVAHNTVNANFTAPFAMEHDLSSGDLIVLDARNKLHRISPNGSVTTVTFILPPAVSIAVTGNAHIDFATGLVCLAYTNYLLTVDPQTGAVTTLVGPTPNGNSIYYGIDNDAYGRVGFLVTAYQVTPTRAYQLLRFDPITSSFKVLATLPTGTLGDVISWQSRMLAGLSRPVRGLPYQVLLSIPLEAGRDYIAGAAFGTLPGIRLGVGQRVPLNPDPLFVLSQTVPAIFSGFQGTLNTSGRAALSVNIPAGVGLQGLHFHLAAVTYSAAGIRVITEPLGVVIE